MPSSYRGEAPDHESNHANPQHGLTMIQADLIVGAQAARFAEPAEGSFHDPAFGQDVETLGVVAPPHNFQMQFAEGPQLFDPMDERAQVAAVGPDDLQAPKAFSQCADQSLGRVAVLDCCAGNHDGQHQSEGVHRQMAFAAFDLFSRVVAAFSGLIGRLDRLAVNNGGGRGHCLALRPTRPVAQGVVDEGPRPILAPLAKVAIDGGPRAEVLGQQPPGAAGTHHMEDGVKQGASLQFDRASAFAFAGLGFGHQRLDLVPFFISKIRRILDRMRLHPFYLLHVPNLVQH